MYKSSIELYQTKTRHQIEDEILKAVMSVGVVVDKEELLKALKHDRDQYDQGFRDGLESAEVVHGWWIPKEDGFWRKQILICSNCESQNGLNYEFNYCPNCGAKMDGERK